MIEQYKALLVEEEKMSRDADVILNQYLKEFGSYMIRNYEIQIECMKVKSTLEFYQTNKKRIDENRLRVFIERKIEGYVANLEELKENVENVVDLPEVDEEAFQEVFKTTLLKIHPKLYPSLKKDEMIAKAYDELLEAYHNNDFEALKNIQKAIDEHLLDTEVKEIQIHDINQKVKKLRKMIDRKMKEPPFTYKILFENKEEKEKALNEFKGGYSYYNRYKEDLEDTLSEVKKNRKEVN